MKLLLLIPIFLYSFVAFGQGMYEVAEIRMNLYLEKECDFNDKICNIVISPMNLKTEVQLLPQDGELVCDELNCEWKDVTHYRGIVSEVSEKDGQRAFGYISIDKFLEGDQEQPKPKPGFTQQSFFYELKVEIIDDKGKSAEMTIGTDNLENLNSVTLVGRNIANPNEATIIPHLSVGKVIDDTCKIPNDKKRDDGKCPDPEKKEQIHPNKVTVLKGHLK